MVEAKYELVKKEDQIWDQSGSANLCRSQNRKTKALKTNILVVKVSNCSESTKRIYVGNVNMNIKK